MSEKRLDNLVRDGTGFQTKLGYEADKSYGRDDALSHFKGAQKTEAPNKNIEQARKTSREINGFTADSENDAGKIQGFDVTADDNNGAVIDADIEAITDRGVRNAENPKNARKKKADAKKKSVKKKQAD